MSKGKKAKKQVPEPTFAEWRERLLFTLQTTRIFQPFYAEVRQAVAMKLAANGWPDMEHGLENTILLLGGEHEDEVGTHMKKAAAVYRALRELEKDETPSNAVVVTLLLWDLLHSPTNQKALKKYFEAKEIYEAEVARRTRARAKELAPTLEEWLTLIQKEYPRRYKKQGDAGILDLSSEVGLMLKHWRARMSWDLFKK